MPIYLDLIDDVHTLPQDRRRYPLAFDWEREGVRADAGPLHPAYVAGLIDGEGSISILRVRTHDSSSGWKYQLQVCVVMREGWLMRRLQRQYGGSVWHQPRRAENHASVYRWRIGDRKAIAMLDSVIEFLRAKRVQAYIAKHFMYHKGHEHRRTPEARTIQEDCFWEQRRLNRRGVERSS